MSPKAKDRPHPGAGHRQRLRERFLEHGLEKFTDAEALELLLTLATPRMDCKQQARELMELCGGLGAVLDADPALLTRVKGVGPKNILGLKLVPAVARRYLEDKVRREARPFSVDRAGEYLRLTMSHLDREVFRVLFLDKDGRLQATEDMSMGSDHQVVVYPRQVVKKALALDSMALVCAHNHPSGDARPSPRDERLTRLLHYALKGVELELTDHLIVTKDKVYSFAKSGALARLAGEYAMLDLGG